MRFLVYWALRREELCDVNLCPDSPDNGGRCDKCPLDRLDVAQNSELGQLLRRALDLEFALKSGVAISLGEIAADEFWALKIIREEQNKLEQELASSSITR